MKASKARLLSEAEANRKEKPHELVTKKIQAATEEICEPEPVTAADEFKIDYRAVIGDKRAQGRVMWDKEETFTAIRIAGMHRIQSP